MVTQTITLYQLYAAAHPQVHAVQGDTGRQLEMIIGDRTVASGATGSLKFERSDHTFYSVTASFNQSYNSFVSDITQALTQPGVTKCQLKVTESSKVVSTYEFDILVEKNRQGTATPQEYYTIEQALDTAEDALETAKAAVDGALEYAQGVAAEVLETAQSAVTTAESAVDISETAMEEAEDARDFVQGIVSELAPSIKSDALSGDIVTFNNGADNWPVNECVISVDAVQDLHGYDNPWPAGGGKNLLPLTLDKIKAENPDTWSNNSYTNNGVTFTVNTDSNGNVIGIAASGTATSNASLRLPIPTTIPIGTSVTLNGNPNQSSIDTRIWVGTSGYADIVSDIGNGVTFDYVESVARIWVQVLNGKTFNGTFYPMIRLASDTDPTFAPYSNICPITGFSEAKVTRTGKNLLNPNQNWSVIYQSDCSVTFADEQYVVTATGADAYFGIARSAGTSYGSVCGVKQYCKVGQTYKLVSSDPNFNKNLVTYYNSNDVSIGYTSINLSEFTVPDNAAYFTLRIGNGNSVSGTTYRFSMMLVLASDTDPTYEPYNGQTVTIDLNGTHYGGTLDVTRGKLRVTHKLLTVSEMDIYYETPGLRFITTEVQSDLKMPSSSSVPANAISSAYKCLAQNVFNNVSNNNAFMLSKGGRISIRNKNYTDPAVFKSARGTDQLLFELATPIEVDLTPTEVSTILGLNHVWADCGTIEKLVLTEDTKGYVDNDKYSKATVITDTASGTIASFPDGADGYPLKECVVNIEAVQSGSGDPSPTNVRPISGWSSAKVTRTGKNLLKHRVYSGTTANIDWVIYDDGTVTFNGTANGTCVVYIANDDTNFYIPWGNYILSDDYPNKTGSWGAFLSLRKNGSYVAQDLVTTYGVGVSSKAFSTSGYDYGNVTVGIYIASGTQLNNAVFKPMIRISSDTDATYEPYLGTTFTISLGDTRYGGTLDVTRGKLRVTHGYVTEQDFGSVPGVNARGLHYANVLTTYPSAVVNGNGISSMLPLKNGDAGWGSSDPCFSIGSSTFPARVYGNFTTLAEFKEQYADLQIVYELATPVEIDLTPTEITTLLGINNVWADTGDIDLTYCADTKLYLDKKVAALQALILEQ